MAKDYKILSELEGKKIEPYPYDFVYKHSIKEIISKKDLEKEYFTAGRVKIIRDFGKLIFADLHWNGDRLQIGFDAKDFSEKEFSRLKNTISSGDIISVSGRLFYTKRKELTLKCRKFKLLTKSLRDISTKWGGLKDTEIKYRQRYRDLIINDDVLKSFILRSEIIKHIRDFLNNKEFNEVETPILQPIYGGASAEPFTTHHNALKRELFLRISPELYLKRLTIGGFEKVYEIGRVFRNEGIDTSHNPEFTMMELYQAFADYEDMMNITEEIISYVAKKVFNKTKFKFKGQEIDLKTPFKRIKMLDAIKEYAGLDVNKMTVEDIKKNLAENGVKVPVELNWGLGVQELFELYVEPKLIQPTFVIDHPKETTPLCKPHRKDKRLIERFELFINGMEMANAYTELNDPRIQEEFFRMQEKRKKMGDTEAHEFDDDFVEALRYGLPPTGGLGIGIDRLVMILTELDSIRNVILFPTLKEN